MPQPQSISPLVFAVILASASAAMMSGCEVAHVSEQAHAQIQTEFDRAAVDAQKARDTAALKLQQFKDNAKLKLAQAEADPARHPVEVANLVIRKIEPGLIGLCFASLIAFVAGWVLEYWFASVGKMLVKFGIRGFFVFGAAAILAPWAPPVIYTVVGGLLVWLIVEIIVDKGNVKQACATIETDVEALIPHAAASAAIAATPSIGVPASPAPAVSTSGGANRTVL
jgi:hypothetical protein